MLRQRLLFPRLLQMSRSNGILVIRVQNVLIVLRQNLQDKCPGLTRPSTVSWDSGHPGARALVERFDIEPFSDFSAK